MPPLPSQKGTAGKKAGSKDNRPSRSSRNTTPSSAAGLSNAQSTMEGNTAFLNLPLKHITPIAYEDVLDQSSPSSFPDSKNLKTLAQRMKIFLEQVDERGQTCEKGYRTIADMLKDAKRQAAEKIEQERLESLRKAAVDDEHRSKQSGKLKKRKDTSKAREERPLTHGAHGLAPQDGSTAGRPTDSTSTVPKKGQRRESRESASSSLSPVDATTPAGTNAMDVDAGAPAQDDEESSSDEHQPPPAPTIPNPMTFGEDPSTFPDPTIYEILEVKPGMTDEEIKKIYSVADYPCNDLHDLIAGTPPDKDFSNAKPSNQVQANTYATFLEPYFRPYNDEDEAFLRERGDRVGPYVMPPRGKRHYSEIWAEEDDAMAIDSPQRGREKLPANQGRGSVEQLDDATAETEQISASPMISRLLATLRPEHRVPQSDANGHINGESNGSGDSTMDLGEASSQIADENRPAPIPPATYMLESATESWKKAQPSKLDHAQMDERLKQELRHIGFLDEDEQPDFDAHNDDDVAARIRHLQTELRATAARNGARKSRIQELVSERLAYQEFNTIQEDLDSQVQMAFVKRSRMGKSKKTKRPGGAGGGSHFVGNGGMARPAVGDNTKKLMANRSTWKTWITPVFDGDFKVPRSSDPNSSIFTPEAMKKHYELERQRAAEAEEEDEE